MNTISSISTKKGKPSVLAKRWGIGLETVKKTLLHTTQRGLCEYLPRSRGVKAKGSYVTITTDV